MKPSTLQTSCTIFLIAMSAAGFSHWWSVEQLVAAYPATNAVVSNGRPTTQPLGSTPETTVPPAPAIAQAPSQQSPPSDPAQKLFYEALIEKMRGLQDQNQNLLDQVAETNRDMMKLEFRVETQSEGFRPLPIPENRPESNLDEENGVLPPLPEIALPVPDEQQEEG